MKTKAMIFAGFLTAAVCVNVSAQTAPKDAKKQNEQKFDDSKMDDDAKFAVMAADAGMLEVKLGELAQQMGTSEKVKTLGKHMVDDHSKANSELKALAAKKNITLPTTMSEKSQKEYDKLSKAKGAEFDKEYAKCMVKDHKEVIAMFEKEAEKGKDPEVKSWAQGKLSTLKHHLQMSEETEAAVKK